MEPEGSLQNSQEPAICLYPESHQCHFLEIHFNVILSFTSVFVGSVFISEQGFLLCITNMVYYNREKKCLLRGTN